MKIPRFFDQYPTPIDTTEMGFDILGIPEFRTPNRGGGRFEISCLITIEDIMEEYKRRDTELNQLQYTVSNIKQEKTLDAVEELRKLVCDEFTKQLKIMSDRSSYFYIPKDRIVQFVSIPVSFLELAPGDTQISFRVFTERYLGEVEDDAEL